MARIGVKDWIVAPITDYTEGQPVTYGTGMKMAGAIALNVTINRRSNPYYYDDEKQDEDKGIIDYTTAAECDDIAEDKLVAVLGEVANTTTSGATTTIDSYDIVDGEQPQVGNGYICTIRDRGVLRYHVYIHRREIFAMDSIEASTKKHDIEWGSTKLTGTGLPVVIDNTGASRFICHKEFATYAAAQEFLYDFLNYTAPVA